MEYNKSDYTDEEIHLIATDLLEKIKSTETRLCPIFASISPRRRNFEHKYYTFLDMQHNLNRYYNREDKNNYRIGIETSHKLLKESHEEYEQLVKTYENAIEERESESIEDNRLPALIQNLKAIDKTYRGFSYYQGYLQIITEEIVLEGKPFGKYIVKYHPDYVNGESPLVIIAKTPLLCSGYIHPHVKSNGYPCLGDHATSIRTAASELRLIDVFELMVAILRVYFEDDALIHIDEFEVPIQCSVEDCYLGKQTSCSSCGEHLCGHHVVKHSCGTPFCDSCYEKCVSPCPYDECERDTCTHCGVTCQTLIPASSTTVLPSLNRCGIKVCRFHGRRAMKYRKRKNGECCPKHLSEHIEYLQIKNLAEEKKKMDTLRKDGTSGILHALEELKKKNVIQNAQLEEVKEI